MQYNNLPQNVCTIPYYKILDPGQLRQCNKCGAIIVFDDTWKHDQWHIGVQNDVFYDFTKEMYQQDIKEICDRLLILEQEMTLITLTKKLHPLDQIAGVTVGL